MKCENCGTSVNLFKITILSPCKLYSHNEIFCNKHTANILIDDPDCIDFIEKID